MEACKSCDHNVIIECDGGCFFPHNTPPCFRQAVESQTTVVQQLKAEIAALITELFEDYQPSAVFSRDDFINKLRQLSAV